MARRKIPSTSIYANVAEGHAVRSKVHPMEIGIAAIVVSGVESLGPAFFGFDDRQNCSVDDTRTSNVISDLSTCNATMN
jgi:hypothetical protein